MGDGNAKRRLFSAHRERKLIKLYHVFIVGFGYSMGFRDGSGFLLSGQNCYTMMKTLLMRERKLALFRGCLFVFLFFLVFLSVMVWVLEMDI